MLPIDVTAEFGKFIGNFVFLLIGAGFGASLEVAGFGDSRRLAKQFYFKDMTVLKTMFTAIIVACILIFLTSALGLLDFSQIAVNQTYLWPGIVGGLIMGVGFVIGGYCPGTSIVSAASFKIDGIFFFIGTLLGAGLFGESVSGFYDFWNSSFSERLLVSDWLGWSLGATVFSVTLMAIAMFYGAEKTEEAFKLAGSGKKISWKISNRKYLSGAVILILLATATWAIGQPDPIRKWKLIGNRYESLLTSRDVFIDPLEYVKTWNDSAIKLVTLDLRPKDAFDKFHLSGAKTANPKDLLDPNFVSPFAQLPAQGVVILVSDDEAQAIDAWKWLKVQGVTNVYILENGLRNWIPFFSSKELPHEQLDFSRPPLNILDLFPKDALKTKIKLKTNKRSGGLCS